jgi:hypothetical protein
MFINNFKKQFIVLLAIISAQIYVQGQTDDASQYQNFEYQPFYLITVPAIIDEGKQGNFALDSSLSGIIVDSVFFYDNIDTANLREINTPRQIYWNKCYEGDVRVTIGTHTFCCKKIEVRNQPYMANYNVENYYLDGVIGEDVFINKITSVDFDKSQISFADTVSIDSLYTALPLLSPRVQTSANLNQKYIEVNGFINNKEEKVSGYFLFSTGTCSSDIILKSAFGSSITLDERSNISYSKLNYGKEDWVYWIKSIHIDTIQADLYVRKLKSEGSDILDTLDGGDGIIGMGVFRKYNFIADYKNNILYLKRNNWPFH